MMFDGTFEWTDDAGAVPDVVVDEGHRRRGFVAWRVLPWLALVPVLGRLA